MTKIYSDEIRAKAIELRKRGLQLKEIRDLIENETKIRIGSLDTISYWISQASKKAIRKSFKLNKNEGSFASQEIKNLPADLEQEIVSEEEQLISRSSDSEEDKNQNTGGIQEMSMEIKDFEKRFEMIEKGVASLLADKSQVEIEKKKREEDLRIKNVVEEFISPLKTEFSSTLSKIVQDVNDKINSEMSKVEQVVKKIAPPEVEHKPTIMHIFSEECRDGSCLASMNENDKLKLRTVLTTPTAKKRFEALGIKMGMTDDQIVSLIRKLGEKLNAESAPQEERQHEGHEHEHVEYEHPANVAPIRK